MSQIEAVAYRVVVSPEQIKKEHKVAGTNLVIEVAYGKNEVLEENAIDTGRVVSIGDDAYASFKPKRQFAGLKVGDLVYFAKYAGKAIRKDGVRYIVLNDDDIVAKVVEDADTTD